MADGNIEAIYPLSPVQQGMLLHSIDGSRPGAYFVQYACDFHGELSEADLTAAWQALIDGHAVLRTLFTWEGRDKPLQIVRRQVDLPLTSHNWRDVAPAQREQRWSALLAHDRELGFDLARAPMLRVAIVALAPRHYRMLVSFHHIVLDGWSLQILVKELASNYRSQRDGTAVRTSAARPFADYLAWLETRDRDRATAYWRRALSGFTTPVLPDFGRPSAGEGNGFAERLEIDGALLRDLNAFARRERITLGTCLAGAWALLLNRYCDSADVVFGLTSAGRPPELDGAENMTGLFINTPPLRVRIDAGSGPADWLREILAAQLAAREFEHAPLVDIHRASEIAPGSPLFESLVVLENVPRAAGALDFGDDLSVSREAYVEYSHYPLALIAIPGETLELRLLRNPRRFGAATARRMLVHVATALRHLCDDRAATLGDIDILPEQEHAIVCAAPPAHGSRKTAIEAIRRQAELTPDAPALAAPGMRCSYAQLQSRVDAVAGMLQANGVGRDTCVPICAGRSAEAIVGILATHACGAAYALVDAAWPRARIDQLFAALADGATADDSRLAPITLADAAGSRVLAARAGVFGIDLLATATTHAASPDPRHEDLAYVIHTSGSTGAPKGVAVTHGNLASSLAARMAFYDKLPARYLLLSPIATDSAIAGIFWPLAAGGTLILAPEGAEQSTEAIADLIATERISHVLCLPSLYGLLLEDTPPESLRSLDTVIIAGEACTPQLVAMHAARLPHASLVNEYGPAEATVWATAAVLDTDLVKRAGTVPIGRPIDMASAYVLGPDRRVRPQGIAGELWIGGAGIARGYWNSRTPEQARFERDPVAPAGRAYRSGDRCRVLDDGQLEFLGRVDNQIKIRGFRVEPEEIEAALEACPGVREAAVVASTAADSVSALAAALGTLPAHEAACWLERARGARVEPDAHSVVDNVARILS